MHHRKSAAAALLLVVAAVVLWSLSGGSRNVAFAQVVDNLKNTKTVQYIEMRSMIPRPGAPKGPTIVTRVMILGRSLERKEVVLDTEGDPQPDGWRWTRSALGVSISDMANGKLVWLDTKNKVFSESKEVVGINMDDNTVVKSEVMPAPEVDFYARIRDVPVEEVEQLPDREIAGQRAIGFHTVKTTERTAGVDTWTRTYWVDPETNLPVEIEHTLESTIPRRGQSRWLLSDIVFNKPLDESLFSTEPPEGYTVRSD